MSGASNKNMIAFCLRCLVWLPLPDKIITEHHAKIEKAVIAP